MPTDPQVVNSTPARPVNPGFTSTDLVLILMALIWGVNISIVKYGTSTMPPLPYNAMRVALAALTLLFIGSLMRRPWPSWPDIRRLMTLGLLGNGIYQILFVEGVSRTLAGNAALVLAATPALIALFSWMRGVEKPSSRALMGIALSIGGVLLVIGTGAFAATRASLSGDLLMLIACICWAAFTVMLKPFMHQMHGVHVAAFTMLGGVLPLFVVATPDLLTMQWGAVPAMAWYSMIFSGIGALVFAYLLWYHGVKVLGPTRTAMYANLQPAVALLFAWILLGEVPTLVQGLGAGGIISGLLLSRT